MTPTALYLRAGRSKLRRERNPRRRRPATPRRIQILIKTRTYRVLRRRPRKYARRLSRTNKGAGGETFSAENVHHRHRYTATTTPFLLPSSSKVRGWSAVSSSLEPSPPTGHYCLVPYSVTNCFIKLKSHNPHCTPASRPCVRPFLLPRPRPGSLRFVSLPCIYAPTCRAGPLRGSPLPLPRRESPDCPSLLPSKIFSSLFFPI